MKTTANTNWTFGTPTIGLVWNRPVFCGREKNPSNNAFASTDKNKFCAVVNDTVVGIAPTMAEADKIFVREVRKVYGRVVRN